ncbi:MAG: response regulator transcription factor [Solirubrobacteraceae bacterium]
MRPLDNIAVAPPGPETAPVVGIVAPPALRRRAATILRSADIPVMATVERASMLKDACDHRQPHVVVVAAEARDAAEELRAVKSALPRSRVVMVLPDRDRARSVVRASVDGVVLEAELALALPIVVWAVALGQSSMPRGLRLDLGSQQLSTREQEVLELAIAGMGNAAIAERLCLSGSTVKTHLASVFSKLGVHSRDEAAAVLREQRRGPRRDDSSTDGRTPATSRTE